MLNEDKKCSIVGSLKCEKIFRYKNLTWSRVRVKTKVLAYTPIHLTVMNKYFRV